MDSDNLTLPDPPSTRASIEKLIESVLRSALGDLKLAQPAG